MTVAHIQASVAFVQPLGGASPAWNRGPLARNRHLLERPESWRRDAPMNIDELLQSGSVSLQES